MLYHDINLLNLQVMWNHIHTILTNWKYKKTKNKYLKSDVYNSNLNNMKKFFLKRTSSSHVTRQSIVLFI